MFGVDDPNIEEAVRAYVKLLRASRAVLGQVEARLAIHGLTPTQLGVLESILHKGPLTHRELGRKVLTSAGNMTDVIDKLEGRGLACRVRDTADRRLVRVELTDAGKAMIENVFPVHAHDIAAAMRGLDPSDLKRLGTLLRQLGIAAVPPAGTSAPLATKPPTT